MADMPHDDELRDSLGDEVAAALEELERTPRTVEMADILHRNVRRVRVRRRATAITAGVVIVATAAVAMRSWRKNPNPVASTVPSPAAERARTTAPPGTKFVTFGGVQVAVPAAWPVVDGMHTGFCAGPFADGPTAFVGPQDNLPPSCPSPSATALEARRDGVWLHPATVPDAASTFVRNAAGTELRQLAGSTPWPIRSYFLAGIEVDVGQGPNATTLFDSIRYVNGIADSPAQRVCARNRDADRMPTPERLAARLVLDNGEVTLAPPRRSDVAREAPAEVWATGRPRPNYLRYRLILTRFSSKYPANPGPNGYEPVNRDVLAWVVYSVPVSAEIPGCGMWGLDVVNATTGASIIESRWAPGP